MEEMNQVANWIGWIVICFGAGSSTILLVSFIMNQTLSRTKYWANVYRWSHSFMKYHGAEPWKNESERSYPGS